jgi:hypothetical protein
LKAEARYLMPVARDMLPVHLVHPESIPSSTLEGALQRLSGTAEIIREKMTAKDRPQMKKH